MMRVLLVHAFISINLLLPSFQKHFTSKSVVSNFF
ncbi:hypothetical protein BDE02_12G080000 [Populus trichocarpa]|nr:hypothetical protein BDE02_12G080000 [Populus trichocarpa]